MKKNSQITIITIVFSLIFFPKLALAQLRYLETTVAAIKRNPIDDMNVVLEGYLLQKIDNDEYIFSDGTGRIVVEIDDDDIEEKRIDNRTKIEIRGEVDIEDRRNNTDLEIDVDRVRVI